MLHRSHTWAHFALIILVLTVGLSLVLPLAAQDEIYFPTTEWRTSTPEEQGMDSAKLAEMFGSFRTGTEAIHSILVIRNGYVVLDASAYPFRSDRPHWLSGDTASVISALVGIAIDQGFIKGVDQSIWDFFPQSTTANMDARKAAITVEDLLIQSSGLSMGPTEDYAMYDLTADDQSWVQYTLDMPMATEAGEFFNGLDANAHLLSAIISQATGMNASEFARKNLFDLLGITVAPWRADPQGITLGSEGLALSPYDMAKLGYLYLRQGEWDERQVLSPAWVEAATIQHSHPGYTWDGYGYLWWTGNLGTEKDHPGYLAFGLGWQEIWVVPDAGLVVVLTGDKSFVGMNVINQYILPSIIGDTALPANPNAQAELAANIEILAAPVPVAAKPVPAGLANLVGKACVMEGNPLGWQSVSLSFGEDQGVLTVDTADTRLEIPFGLDGVYRVSDARKPSDPMWLPTGPFWRPVTDVPLAGRLTRASDTRLTFRVWDLSGGQAWDINLVFDQQVSVTLMPSIEADIVRLSGVLE